MNSCHCDNMNGLEATVLGAASQTEKDRCRMVSLTGGPHALNKAKQPIAQSRERISCQRWGQGVGKTGEGGQKVHTSSYKMNESW